MLTVKQGMKLSAIIDKMDIKINDPKASQEQIGADLIMQIVRKAYKAESEVYSFISETKGISVQDAQKTDLVAFIKETMSDPSVASFFKSAVK